MWRNATNNVHTLVYSVTNKHNIWSKGPCLWMGEERGNHCIIYLCLSPIVFRPFFPFFLFKEIVLSHTLIISGGLFYYLSCFLISVQALELFSACC